MRSNLTTSKWQTKKSCNLEMPRMIPGTWKTLKKCYFWMWGRSWIAGHVAKSISRHIRKEKAWRAVGSAHNLKPELSETKQGVQSISRQVRLFTAWEFMWEKRVDRGSGRDEGKRVNTLYMLSLLLKCWYFQMLTYISHFKKEFAVSSLDCINETIS